MTRLTGLFLVFFLAQACGSLPTMSSEKSGGLVESFYRGQGAMLYFVKPINFVNEEDDLSMDADFTYDFNKQENQDDIVLVNFSVYTPLPIKNLSKVTLITDEQEISGDSLSTFFVEEHNRKKFGWHNRHSVQITYDEFKAFVEAEQPAFLLKSDDMNGKFTIKKPKKWQKKSEIIKNKIFIPVDHMQ